jgi:hypothetical protein
MKLYASDLQTFLGGRTILYEVEEEEMYVTTLLEEQCLQQVNLFYLPEAKMVAIDLYLGLTHSLLVVQCSLFGLVYLFPSLYL